MKLSVSRSSRRRFAAFQSKDQGGSTADVLLISSWRRWRAAEGYIARADLAGYRPTWRDPLVGEWAGYRVITAPLPSSGGIALLSLLEMKHDLASSFEGLAANSTQYVHLLAEIEKRVFADRAEYLGDPAFFPGPVSQLLDHEYLAKRAGQISLDRPTPTDEVRPGLVDHHNTTHFSIVDRWGNAVSNTYTLNDFFGSGQVITGAGFLINNEMDDFSAKTGAPNLDGVVGGDANAIAPGKRPLSTMTPTILTHEGRVAVVIGTPGGSRIATSIFQVLTNWHDFHMPLEEAVAAPRIHHQLLPPDTLFEEPYAGLDPAVQKGADGSRVHVCKSRMERRHSGRRRGRSRRHSRLRSTRSGCSVRFKFRAGPTIGQSLKRVVLHDAWPIARLPGLGGRTEFA